MDLSIIIVNWNTRELLRGCLQSVYQQTVGIDFEVIVIDNGSDDGSATMVSTYFPQVKLVRNAGNAGYVRANNQGITASIGRYILLLNADTVIGVNSLQTLTAYLDAHPRVGVLGPRLLNPDNSVQQSVRRLPRWRDNVVVLTKLHNFWPQLLDYYLMTDFDYRREAAVEQVMGAAMFIRRTVLNQIGDLDKRFWQWYEDVDYCRRVRLAGWEVRYAPVADIMHYKGQSFAQQLSSAKQRVLVHSMLAYTTKHQGRLAALALLPFVAWSYAAAIGVQLFGIKKPHKHL